jgi:hypothetical protein
MLEHFPGGRNRALRPRACRLVGCTFATRALRVVLPGGLCGVLSSTFRNSAARWNSERVPNQRGGGGARQSAMKFARSRTALSALRVRRAGANRGACLRRSNAGAAKGQRMLPLQRAFDPRIDASGLLISRQRTDGGSDHCRTGKTMHKAQLPAREKWGKSSLVPGRLRRSNQTVRQEDRCEV